MVWRRFRMSVNTSLADFHYIILIAQGLHFLIILTKSRLMTLNLMPMIVLMSTIFSRTDFTILH
ncbi:plasmid pRiA4b ORF-3-like family protein [Xenorhabdus sp. PB62.4]|nr:plasmid pRiA4b ORF-3-like family protein [Xenorhabdus sp. PB62.4]